MLRIYPHKISDKAVLCDLLGRYLELLSSPPLNVDIRTLSFDTKIPESIFHRMLALNDQPEDDEIEALDYHILFSNLMFRFPTIRIWQTAKGEFFFER
jgi:hypothetical protein